VPSGWIWVTPNRCQDTVVDCRCFFVGALNALCYVIAAQKRRAAMTSSCHCTEVV
jgi:hypothetical protein